ncbi:HlyD family secretion protein [Tessaracoccus antarcticus]|uniref:HlyD family secretion protein n=1 Tax=Tessaracoccus antarcticus TaxID=2479848 RepID=A0A3M0GBL6_9ACTN|nr:HlyD family secretion protein [Tessaracoccus antarcticus]RMB61787.1 HlyD family secretion protein [Tessaracoccus antarcticus]
MTWLTRLKMFGGILAVLALSFALTLLFNQRMTQAHSVTATVTAPTFDVGSGYGGIVNKQLAQDGDQVSAGDVLFVVSSSSLQQAVSQGGAPGSTVAYQLDLATGTVTYTAVSDGYLVDVAATLGSYVPDGAVLARVVSQERTVEGLFSLSPVDYGRVEEGAAAIIVLPNLQTLEATVDSITVETEDGKALAVIRLTSDALTDPVLASLTRDGTPVTTQVQLRDDGVLAGPTTTALSFLTKIGLR